MMTALTILFFTAVLAAYSVLGAAPGYIRMKRGENYTMGCSTKDKKKDSFLLYARLPVKYELGVYDSRTNKFHAHNEYCEKVYISGTFQKLTVRLTDLQLNDSGLYIGRYRNYNFDTNVEEEEEGCYCLLFVNDVEQTLVTEKTTGKNSPALSEPLVLVLVLTTLTMVVVLFLMMWVLAPKVKAKCVTRTDDTSREYNPVYEDMHRVQNK